MQILDKLLGNLFKVIYNTINSFGIGSALLSNYALTLIVMGLIYKLITIPFMLKNAKNAERQKELQPELEKLQKKYGYDKQIYQQKMMEFQKEHKMMQNTGAGCLTFIIQMIIMIALYNVIRNPQNYLEGYENISRSFLWVSDLALADPTGFALPLINSLSQLGFQYLNRNTMQTAGSAGNSMMAMMYFMPIMFFFIFRTLPAGLVLYWATGNVIEIIIRFGAKLFKLSKNRG